MQKPKHLSDEAWALSARLAIRLGQFEKSGDVPVRKSESEEGETRMAIVRESKGKAPEVPEDFYTFTIIKAETGTRQSDKFGKAGEPTLTVFCQLDDIVDEDGDVIVLDPELSLKFSRGGKYQPSNLYLFAKAAGVLPEEGEPFDTDWLVGKVLKGKVAPDEESGWPKIEAGSLVPVKTNGAKAPSSEQETRQPPEGVAVDAATASAWWKARLGEGFERVKVIDLCKAMFEGRIPGELNADELAGLTDQLNMTT